MPPAEEGRSAESSSRIRVEQNKMQKEIEPHSLTDARTTYLVKFEIYREAAHNDTTAINYGEMHH